MKYYVAVQVQYPHMSYVNLFPLDGRQRAQRRLAPIEVDQRVAVVKLFLMRSEDGSSSAAQPERELHTFRFDSLPGGTGTAPILGLHAEYDGARTVYLRISGSGGAPQTASVRVPRRRRWWWWLLLFGLLAFLGLGTFAVLQTPTTEDATAPGRQEEPAGAAESDVDESKNRTGEISSGANELTAAEEREPEAGEQETSEPVPERALPETDLQVYFEPNRVRLTDAARRELDELVSVLREYPEVPVSIVGHTALYGTEEGRIEISRGRAQGVASYLRSQGWAPETDPSIRWIGSQNPITRDRERQQRNRRVEVSVGEDQSSR